MLNIDKQGQLLFNGKVLSGGQAVAQIKFEADLARENRKTLLGKKFDATEGLAGPDRDPRRPRYAVLADLQHHLRLPDERLPPVRPQGDDRRIVSGPTGPVPTDPRPLFARLHA